MMRWLYACCMVLLQPLLLRKLRRRALAEPGYGVAVEERFGAYTQPCEAQQAQPEHRFIWVHAVSLGETRAAAALVAQLRKQFPGMRLLLTNGTATGREQGAALLQPGDVQVWQPWDTPAATGRFLKHFKPRFGVLIETEIWPNLVAQCVAANTPLCLVNARCNDKTYRKARQLTWLSRPAYAGLSAVWAQSRQDADRLTALGARVLGVTGNFKFDATPDAALLARAASVRQRNPQRVLMFASSREGEEQMLLDVLKQKVPSALSDQAQSAINSVANVKVQWLLVPRHPQRFDAVTALCQSAGFSVSRRSTWVNDEPQAADIWLGDSVGEMALYFGMADVALLGGSFAPLGGQNLIEAAACGCPVVMGPHTFNFTEASRLAVQAGAAFEQPDMAAAVGKAMQLVADVSALAAAKSAASALSLAHRGAAQRTVEAIRSQTWAA